MNVQQLFKNHKWGDQIIHEQENAHHEQERKWREEQERRRKEEREKRRREYQAKIDAYIQKNGPYWHYNDADTYVEINKYSAVPAMDKVNQMRAYFMGNDNELAIMMTLVGTNQEPYTMDEYHTTFCDKKNYNGKEIWVYRGL